MVNLYIYSCVIQENILFLPPFSMDMFGWCRMCTLMSGNDKSENAWKTANHNLWLTTTSPWIV